VHHKYKPVTLLIKTPFGGRVKGEEGDKGARKR
jgi:hypothetical protein